MEPRLSGLPAHWLGFPTCSAAEPATEACLWAVPGAVLRVLVGDHTAMLAFLALAWPVGTMSNTLVQLVSLCLIATHNRTLCATPVRLARGA